MLVRQGVRWRTRESIGRKGDLPNFACRSEYVPEWLGISNTIYLNFDQSNPSKSNLRTNFAASCSLSLPNLSEKIKKNSINGLQKKEGWMYHNSPSKNTSLGSVSSMKGGMLMTCPWREYIFLVCGFQKPRIPSYFSNIHLFSINKANEDKEKTFTNW